MMSLALEAGEVDIGTTMITLSTSVPLFSEEASTVILRSLLYVVFFLTTQLPIKSNTNQDESILFIQRLLVVLGHQI